MYVAQCFSLYNLQHFLEDSAYAESQIKLLDRIKKNKQMLEEIVKGSLMHTYSHLKCILND